jgi:hypothetical protein
MILTTVRLGAFMVNRLPKILSYLAASDLGQKPTHFRDLRQKKSEKIFHATVMLLIT